MRKVLLFIFTPLVLIVLLLPYLLSIPPLKNLLIAKFESQTNARIEINTIRFSWLGPQVIQGIHIFNAQLNGHLEQVVLKTPFWKIASQPYSLTISNGDFQVLASDASKGSIEQIHAIIDGSNVHATGVTTSGGRQGSFTVQGTAVTADQFDLAFSMDAMPTDPIDCLLGFKGDLNAFLGSSFNLTGSVANHSNHGSIIIDLAAVNSAASVQATFTPTSVTLDAPLSVSGPIPPSIQKELAKKGLQLKDPVSVAISNNSFHFPRPFLLGKLEVGSASVNLGRISVPKPEGFDSLSVFLRTPQISNPNQLDVWLTPIDFSLSEGLVNLERVDALLGNSLHLCCWGKTNLLTERLNMIVGVPSDALTQTGILSNISPSYVLQVPVTGTFKDPIFDTKTATVQIAGAIAAGQAQKAGGNFGAIGDLVGQTVSIIAQPQQTPPLKYNLPWQR